MLTNNLINLDIVNLMSIISENTALILIHFSGIAVILVPTVLMSKRSDKILKALQIVASSTIATKGGVDGYNYLKHKFSGSENPQPSDGNNPQDNNKPSGSDKPSAGDSGIKDASSK